MSRISAQCDELRSMAESVGLEVPQAATLMMGAADAINRLDAENVKLREERDGWKKLCTDQEVMHIRREETLDDENTKLRELARLLLWGVDNDMPRAEGLAWSQRVNALVSELGVEVDG